MLLGGGRERAQVAALALLCAADVEEGFGVAFRIMQDFHMKLGGVLRVVTRRLAAEERVGDVMRLVTCVQQSGIANPAPLGDEVLQAAITVFIDNSDLRAVEQLAKRMVDVAARISVYIDSHQLKTAYLLAVQSDRLDDIRRIMSEAKKLGQTAIYRICAQKLNIPMQI